jgi:hypothetical protein
MINIEIITHNLNTLEFKYFYGFMDKEPGILACISAAVISLALIPLTKL